MHEPAEGSGPQSMNPYVGPRPFIRAEADRFFGRRLEARDVRSLWLGDKVTVLHGPSAAGKTSLLQAGVLPMLSPQQDIDLLLVGNLGHRPARPLAAPPPHNGYSYTLLDSWAQSGDPLVPGMPISEFLLSRARGVATDREPGDILAAIDQLEVLFTAFPARQAERDEFIDELAAALTQIPELKLLLIVGDDHLAALSSYERRLFRYQFSYVQLDTLTPEAALSAITLPLVGTRRAFDANVADELAGRLATVTFTDMVGESAEIRGDSVEPLLLQIVCAELWSSLPDEVRLIKSGDLHASGGINQALARFYNSAVSAVHRETGQPEDLLREWMESTFITEHGTRGTANRGIVLTAGMPNEAVDAFERLRVLTLEYRARGVWLQLSQDMLIAPIQEANRAWRLEWGIDTAGVQEPVSLPAYRAAAEAALAEGNFPSARRFAQAAVADYRQVGDTRRLAYTLLMQGSIARSEGDLAAAEENFQEALSTFAAIEDRNSVVRTLSALADVNFTLGNYRTAADLQRQAIEWLPTDVDAMVGLAYALWYGGSAADAESIFSQALSANSRFAAAFAGRGQVRAEIQEYTAALDDLDRAFALGLPPNDEIDARSARALALAGLSRVRESEAELQTARNQDQSRGRTLRRTAKIAFLRSEYALALETVEQALRAEPALPPWDETDARRLRASLRQRITS